MKNYIKATDKITAWMYCNYNERRDIKKTGTIRELEHYASEILRTIYDVYDNNGNQLTYDRDTKKWYLEV